MNRVRKINALNSPLKMSTQSILASLGQFPFFAGMPEKRLKPLLAGFTKRLVPDHEPLFSLGQKANSFCIITSGAFKLARLSPRGEEVILQFATPGDVIGALIMPAQNPHYPISAIALQDSKALMIPRSTYLASWLNCAEIQHGLNASVYSRLCSLQDSKALSRLCLNNKVAFFLLSIANPDPQATQHLITLQLSRQEIAAAVGCTVEALIRCLSKLKQMGLIRLQGRHIELLYPEKLREIVKSP